MSVGNLHPLKEEVVPVYHEMPLRPIPVPVLFECLSMIRSSLAQLVFFSVSYTSTKSYALHLFAIARKLLMLYEGSEARLFVQVRCPI